MTTITLKMIDTAEGEVLVERMFESGITNDLVEMESTLIRILSMQWQDVTHEPFAVISDRVIAEIDAGNIAFTS